MSEHDVDLIVARLREELSAGGDVAVEGGGESRVAWVARAHAERFWAVTADRPFLYKPGTWGRIRGTLLVPPKIILRKLVRWYVEPALAQQRDFNSSLLTTLDQLNERIDGVNERLDHLNERVGSVPAPPTAAATFSSSAIATGVEHVPDYFAFQAHLRGSRDLIRERQRPYLADFRDAAPILDIGCGRGEFLELLRGERIEARGIDLDPDMVEHCRHEGLDVQQADAVRYLESLEDDFLGGIFCSHVAEHLAPSALFRLLELAAKKLRPEGILVAETPNPRALLALSMFFTDLTHLRPVDPEAFAFLGRQAGLRQVETRFLNEPPAEERLQPVRLPDPADEPARLALAKNIDRINEVVFGPQDFALVARA